MSIKRSREDHQVDFESSLAMANYLLMLSGHASGPGLYSGSEARTAPAGRVFECKTCNRQFPSFQALGGHRASHKKPRPGPGPDSDEHIHDDHDEHNQTAQNFAGKPKTHECSICGLEFSVGQALGGHMRRHRASLTGSQPQHHLTNTIKSNIIKGDNNNNNNNNNIFKCLDLNLTPLENGLIEFGTIALISC